MKYDLSICQPAIRPEYWSRFYDSLTLACRRYAWELIIVSPYNPPEELLSKINFKFIKDYGTSCRAAMLGATQCQGEFLCILSDEGTAQPDSLDLAIDLFRRKSQDKGKHAVVLRYREGENFKANEFPREYWYARHHPVLNGLNINRKWKHLMQWMMPLDYFIDIGGYDCRFEHMAFAGHDLAYRVQRDGCRCHLSPTEIMHLNWFPGDTGDHGPVFQSHEHNDLPLFRDIQLKKDCNSRIRIDFDNWKNSPSIWSRRWPNGIPEEK